MNGTEIVTGVALAPIEMALRIDAAARAEMVIALSFHRKAVLVDDGARETERCPLRRL
jgi:hypothetical protein